MMQKTFWAAVIALFTVVLLVTGTQAGWLVRAQTQSAAGGRLVGWVDDQTTQGRIAEREREARIAAQNPDDFQTQMAVALKNVSADAPVYEPNKTHLPLDELSGQKDREGKPAADRLRGLLPRFGDRSALHATILRYLSLNAVRLPDRGESRLLSGEADPIRFDFDPAINQPHVLWNWEAACVAGDELDPQNAYFPAMMAARLFAENRVAEAEVFLIRAGRRPDFNDYAGDETKAMWHLMRQMSGNREPGAIPRMAQHAALTFGHYSLLRQLARVATVRAMQAEIAGDPEKGFQIRHAVSRIGAAMRASGKGITMGALVGGGMMETSCLRPGGAPVSVGKGRRVQVQTGYRAYLERIGHGDEVPFVVYENEARKQVSVIYRSALFGPDNVINVCAFGPLIVAWIVGMGLLTNALVVALAGGFAMFCHYSLAVQNRWVRAIAWAACALGAGCILFVLAYKGGAFAAASFGWGTLGVFANGNRCLSDTERIFDTGLVGLVSVLGALGPLVLVLAVRSRRARFPVGLGVAHGLVRCAPPVVVVLLITYGGVAAWTLQQEAQLTQKVKGAVQSEGPYLAQKTGKPWPGLFVAGKGTKQ